MEQVITNSSFQTEFIQSNVSVSLLTRFFTWCEQQEESRFLWLALAFMVNIGMALPMTLVSINYFAGGNFGLWIVAAAVNVPVLALNLAAQPTRVTLPFLFVAWLVNVILIIASIVMHFAL